MRIEPAIVARLDAHAAMLTARTGVKVDRSDVARSAVERGLTALEEMGVAPDADAPTAAPQRKRAGKEGGR